MTQSKPKNKKIPEYKIFPLDESAETSQVAGIGILEGEFQGVGFKFGKVGFTEDQESPMVHFEYVVYTDHEFKGAKLKRFETMIGDLLVEAIVNAAKEITEKEE